MAKKCYNCGFSDNPDSANFCGKCGNKLSLLDNWKIYNASFYCLVTKSEYDKYKQLKEKSERTFFKRIIDWFSVNWHIFKGIGYSIASLLFLITSIITIPNVLKEHPWYEAILYSLGLVVMCIGFGVGAFLSFKGEDV
ncbi:zinc ribbon domain-containing protein [Bacteroides caecigallinarum]|uniref:zinc ribbon domain-containing protein n=1 Tax=Bacteroides caecigallinarum TaxID=1411144 RepID=UPI00195D83A1|nr:zinc ribbon domain-containing protein [Bacteroides caecigallinarum]MBM6883991.1 zinc ribbon domain-containing protein [Bacteroides caecigallinarum]